MCEDLGYREGQLVLDSKQELVDEIERLKAALKPFAEVARGDRLNPTPDEWQRASALIAAE